MPKTGGIRPQAQNAAAAALQVKFNMGVALHQQGKLVEAERIYGEVLRQQPNHFDALHFLGIIAAQTQRTERAVELIGKAIGINAKVAAAHCNLGNALNDLKRPAEALASYDRAIALKPDFAEAYYNRGNALNDLKQPAEALASYDKAIALKPDFAEAYCNRGNALQDLKRPAAALASYDRAIALKSDYAEAYGSRGNSLYDLKRHTDALASYDKAIALKPDHVEAYNNRGNALLDLKRPTDALMSYDRAIALKPDYAEAHNNRGNALQDLKRSAEALASYDKAIALKPDFAEGYGNRGNALKDLKRPTDALASYDKAIALKPDYAEAHNNRGNALQDLKRPGDALASCDKAIALRPDFAEAYSNGGAALLDLKRPAEALVSCDKAIALKADYAEAYSNRGAALLELKRPAEALASCDKAIALKADYAEAYNNRGNALLDLKRHEDALASYDRAIALMPDYAEAYNNRGNALKDLKRPEDALASYDKAIALKQDYADGFLNRALCRLLAGRYIEGWSDFEWRWDAKDFPSKRPKFANWQGEDLDGRHLLVFSEQGLGDIIQFARYLPSLARNRCQLTFLAPAKLTRLLRPLTSGIEVISTLGTERTFDFQCALMSLPHRLGIDLASIPNSVPYLRAEDALIARWRERIGEHGFKIGIAWQGNPQNNIDQGRSIALTEYLALARLPGVRLISLQKQHGLDQLARLSADTKIEILGDEFDSGADAFIDTAAVMQTLDLIITSDTSIAHLAGALGRPTWVALKYVPDWRWLLDREDSPWYPTMRLFRQSESDNWKPVFSAMERELQPLLIGGKANSAQSFGSPSNPTRSPGVS